MIGQTEQADALLNQARRAMLRRDMQNGDAGARLQYLTAQLQYQTGQVQGGDAENPQQQEEEKPVDRDKKGEEEEAEEANGRALTETRRRTDARQGTCRSMPWLRQNPRACGGRGAGG